jgi:hypothetical protein
MNNGKNTFAANPGPVLMLDTTIVQNRSFVELDASTMDLFGEEHFIPMKVVPT